MQYTGAGAHNNDVGAIQVRHGLPFKRMSPLPLAQPHGSALWLE